MITAIALEQFHERRKVFWDRRKVLYENDVFGCLEPENTIFKKLKTFRRQVLGHKHDQVVETTQ